MDQVNAIRARIGAVIPGVTITDYDDAIHNTVTRVYPEAKLQIYIFYINKNVVL